MKISSQATKYKMVFTAIMYSNDSLGELLGMWLAWKYTGRRELVVERDRSWRTFGAYLSLILEAKNLYLVETKSGY